MGRALPIAAAILIVIAGGIWLMWPVGPCVRPAPGSVTSTGDPAKPPALATAGRRSAAGDAIPAGDGAAGAKEAAAEPPGPLGKKPWIGTLEMMGRIVDAAGKPLAGAKVRAKNIRAWPGEPSLPTIETGADGHFSFRDLVSGPFQVWVDFGAGERLAVPMLAPGQGPIDVSPPVPTPGDRATIDAPVVLVFGPDGKPVPRADVLVRMDGRFGGFTDLKDGRLFRMPVERPEITIVYEVLAARDVDFSPLPIGPGAWTAGSGGSTLTLPVGKTIEGDVVGPDGKGIFGATVSASPAEAAADPRSAMVAANHGRATTDASGHFRLLSLGAGPYRLSVTPLPPHLPLEAVEALVGSTDARIRVVPGVEADVTVLDVGGAPVPGARVDADAAPKSGFGLSGSSRLLGTSQQIADAAGRVHLSQIDPTLTYGLAVTPPQSRRDLGRWDARTWEPKDVTVHLPRAWSLKGTVRRADGAAQLSFVHRRGVDGSWRIVTTTKKDGTFEIKFTEPGPWVLAASASFDTPRGAELTITDPALAAELTSPAATSAAPTK